MAAARAYKENLIVIRWWYYQQLFLIRSTAQSR
jgi:hypothetical protein